MQMVPVAMDPDDCRDPEYELRVDEDFKLQPPMTPTDVPDKIVVYSSFVALNPLLISVRLYVCSTCLVLIGALSFTVSPSIRDRCSRIERHYTS